MFASAGWAVPLSALVAIHAGSGGAAAASAPAGSIRFEYVRGAGAERCPDREALLTGIKARLGYDPFDERGVERVRCEIAGTAGGLRSRVETWDKAGRSTGARSLTSPRSDCSDLAS